MKIIINIPKEQYDMILLSDNTAMAECVSKEAMMYAIKNGQVLDDNVTLAKQNTGMSWKEKLSQIKKGK